MEKFVVSVESGMRRTADMLLPLVLGTLIGFLASQAMFAGRIAALETRAMNVESRLGRIESKLDGR